MLKTAMKALVLASALAAGTSAVAKETIHIGELSWDGARGIQSVLKVVLEDNLDVDVETVAVDQAVMFMSMDKGRGGVDVLPDLWLPQHNNQWEKYIAPGSRESVLANDKPYTGTQGLFIPGYIQDTYGITSIEQLADPEVAKLFDADGDGRGDYWPGDPSWDSTKVERVKAKSFGYDEYFKALEVPDAIFKGYLKKAVRKNVGLLFYYWTPEWIFAEYDLRQLKEPAFDGYAMESKKDDPLYKAGGCWNMYDSAESGDWLAKSEVTCGWQDGTVHVVYSKSLEERAPRVAKFLKHVSFDPRVVNQWILKIGMEKQDPLTVARTWVEANPDTVNAWLSAAE
ncbi:MAG: ABC transporter substrate-binding protein [Oceanospirillaceae bacterium]|nr:ABC transporter substrate-binding protein [Oceanospirillaceae bacterium]